MNLMKEKASKKSIKLLKQANFRRAENRFLGFNISTTNVKKTQ